MFGRRPKSNPTAARAALKDPLFACPTPGVAAVHVDYDPAIWVRTPKPGQDRTDWVAAHLDAYAADLGLFPADERYQAASRALDLAANSALPHTCDFVSLASGQAETGAVAYLNVVDEELGLLEHGAPEAFVRMEDLEIDERKQPRPEYYPTRKTPRSWQVTVLQSVDPESRGVSFLRRAYRFIDSSSSRPPIHLYAGGFFSAPRTTGPLLSLFTRVDVELAPGTE